VPILLVVGIVSLHLRNDALSIIGLKRLVSSMRVGQIALAAVLRIVLGDSVVDLSPATLGRL